MAKPENQFISGVHKYLPSIGVLHREKMANPYRGGTADWWYSGRGKKSRDLWIEWKFLQRVPVRVAIDLVSKGDIISALQRQWLRNRHEEGRNVWVGVGCAGGGLLLRSMAWELPIDPAVFRSQLVDRKTLACQIESFTLGRS